MRIVVFWVVTLCSLVSDYKNFGGRPPSSLHPENGSDTFL
jgi:hypothetical protein